jgi:glycosyltransferase involved in cell wall biosynthesis
MNILYHLTVPPPEMPECEAISQEINALRGRFGGDLNYLNPNQFSPIYIPRILFGLHQLKRLRARETQANVHIHHLYNPDPFPFPILRKLRRPVVYSLTGGVARRPTIPFFASMGAVTVADERSLGRLESWGLDNVTLVPSGIDTSQFTYSPLPLQSGFRLMVGSAPWTRAQFKTKGVEALLEAARQSSRLSLVFLWRGVLTEEMEHRVHCTGLEGQVEILNRKVDVNKVLAGVHASVALAAGPAIIRSYPHSLMESLAAGKPIIVSQCIPMADYVQRTGCGVVVEDVTPTEVLTAIELLTREYTAFQESACQVGNRDFSQQATITSYHKVYERVLESTNQL